MQNVRLSRFIVVVIIIAGAFTLANCEGALYAMLNAPAHIGPYERRADISYGPAPRQTLDVYVPTGASRRPVVVFWYGGLWLFGTKERYRFVGAALANSGYVAVLPDYRLYPEVRFPQFIEDGAAAVRWVHEHAHEIGGDPNAVFLMGHSAGAHIAATLALDPQYLRRVGGSEAWVRGWIGISAPYELDVSRHPVLPQIFCDPYVASDWQLVSLVNAQSAPALLIQGTHDGFVKTREVLEMDGRLRAAGVPVEMRIYEASHMDTVAGFSWPLRYESPSLADVTRFIDKSMTTPPRIVYNAE